MSSLRARKQAKELAEAPSTFSKEVAALLEQILRESKEQTLLLKDLNLSGPTIIKKYANEVIEDEVTFIDKDFDPSTLINVNEINKLEYKGEIGDKKESVDTISDKISKLKRLKS